jgi:hypothetical protein
MSESGRNSPRTSEPKDEDLRGAHADQHVRRFQNRFVLAEGIWHLGNPEHCYAIEYTTIVTECAPDLRDGRRCDLAAFRRGP